MTPQALASFHHMFTLGLPIAEKIIRPIIVYVCLVILIRVFGKRELAQLNPFDLVVLLSLSNTVQNAIIGDDTSVTGGIIGALSLLLINYLAVRFFLRHRRLDQLLEGDPTTLITGGVVDRKALAKELLNESELLTVAHRQGFCALDEIDSCVLESNGNFFIQGKTPPTSVLHHQQLMARLDQLEKKLDLAAQR
ncbi:MAG TPA: YetF domain-containing protein [Thermoanaerobaculia bacterium]|nr:YetF domain-containing protein [Thermoanaerobaculia bacterium]